MQSAVSNPSKRSSRILVEGVISGRYAPGSRPVSWDQRRDGIETIRSADGSDVTLYSTGGQSTPGPRWELLLGDEVLVADGQTAFTWTLYGIQPAQ